jgi:cytochrome P450
MALIDDIARELIAGFGAAQDIDIVKRFADVLPPLFIGRLLGLPDALALGLTAVVTEVTKSFDDGRSLRFYQRVNDTVIKARAMIDPEIADRRSVPRDDGLTRMIALWDQRFGLDAMALGSHVIFLLIAGVETTSALIGNALAAAIDRPEWLAILRGDANLVAPWIEETLRFDGPTHQTSRIALSDCQIAGASIAKGDRLILLIGAAHRDPTQFAVADEFDPWRGDQALLAFGVGLHFCLGAQIARMEAIASLSLLAPRLQPDPNSPSKRHYWEHRTLRRLLGLPVRLLPSYEKG